MNNIGSLSSPARLGLIYDAFARDYAEAQGGERANQHDDRGLAVPITSLSLPPQVAAARNAELAQQMQRVQHPPSVGRGQDLCGRGSGFRFGFGFGSVFGWLWARSLLASVRVRVYVC